MAENVRSQPTEELAEVRCATTRRTVVAEDYILIWLDANIDESHDGYQQSLDKLRRIVTYVDTVTDLDP